MNADLSEGITFFDIGANVGYYTVLGARRVGLSGRVIALEPDPSVVAILRSNVELNPLDTVEVIQGAACATRRTVKFGRSGSGSYSSVLSCESANDRIEVPGYPLGSLAVEFDVSHVDLIKLDVERAEIETITVMRGILGEGHTKVVVELHNHISRADSSPAIKELENAHYSIRFISDNHVIAEAVTPAHQKHDCWSNRLS